MNPITLIINKNKQMNQQAQKRSLLILCKAYMKMIKKNYMYYQIMRSQAET